MSEYRRLYQPGGSYFFTIVTHQRIEILSLPDNINRLRSAFDRVMKKHPFTMEAFVILPDHIHCIWGMPPQDSNYSTRWRLIKSYFSGGVNHSVNKRGEREIWQRRFWEHLLRARLRDWDRSITAWPTPEDKRESLRDAIIKQYGGPLELIADEGEATRRGRKRRKKRRKR